MSDDKSKCGPADAQHINVNEDCEVKYWTQTLGVSEERHRETVERVGACHPTCAAPWENMTE